MKLHRPQLISIIVLVAFAWNMLGVANLALAFTHSTDSTTTATDNPLLALGVKTQGLADALKNVQEGLQRGEDQTAQLNAAGAQVNDILALKDPVSATVAEIKEKLPQDGSIPQEILDRHAALVNKTREGFDILAGMAANLQQLLDRRNPAAADLAPILGAMETLAPPPTAEITGTQPKLPHRKIEIEKRALSGKPAREIGWSTPTLADLAETRDIRITQEIKDLAAQLEYDPVQMYLYVLNKIDFQPYFGSVKGSQGVFWEKAGNDVDQASFLIALYRAAGIPARYITGEVQLSIDQAMNWTGARTLQAAVKMLQTHGLPLETVTGADGSIIAVKFDHIWVETHVKDNLHGHKWVQLAPAFKQYQYVEGIDVKQVMGFDPESFLNAAKAGATINEAQSYVTRLNEANIQSNLQAYGNNLTAWVNANLPGATVGEVLGCRKIVETQMGRFHKMVLPFQNATPQAELAELPDSQRFLARFQMSGFTYDISLPELYGQRLTLAYVPASQWDQQMIDDAGGIFNVFAMWVNMKPQLKLEGQVVAEGQGVTLGSTQICRSSFLRPLGAAWDSNDKYVTTGADYSVSLDHQRISADLLQQRLDKYKVLVANLPGGVITQEAVEEALHLTGMVYFGETDGFSNMAAKMSNVSWTREPSQNFLVRDLRVISFFGFILGVQRGSVGMDVKRNIVGPVSSTGKADDERTWMLTVGAFGSAAEHGVFEKIYGIESVSTEKLLALANQRGIPVYTINQDNINQILPSLPLAGIVKQNIYDAVNSGWIAVVPRTGLQVNQWFGYGWQIIDPNSGAAGYLLAGYLTSGNAVTGGGSGSEISPDAVFLWGLAMLALGAFEKLGLIPEIAAAAGVSSGLAIGTMLLYFGLGLVILAIGLYIYNQYASRAALNYYRRHRYDSFTPSFMIA